MNREKEKKANVIGLKVCSWCQELLGFGTFPWPEDQVGKTTPISHGICKDCKEDVEKKLNAMQF